MMRIVVFSALFGGNDVLKSPRIINPKVRYVCMTDRADTVKGWDLHRLQQTERPRWLARWAKTQLLWLGPHDVSIWLDASFELLVDPVAIVAAAAVTNAPIVGFLHPDRSRIVDEAKAIIRWQLAPAVAVKQQLATYQAAGFDTAATPQRQLTTTGVLVRWASPDVTRFNDAWWREIQRHTLRDQLSVDFCAYACQLPVGYLPGHYRANPFVRYDHTTHRRKRSLAS